MSDPVPLEALADAADYDDFLAAFVAGDPLPGWIYAPRR